jgi:hypothetical protein
MGAVPLFALGGMQLFGAGMQAAGAKSSGRLASQEARFNAQMAEIQADDALARGNKASDEVRRTGRRVMGAQRVASAGQGILVDAGSAGELLDDTRKMTEEDILTAKNNAWREAFGYQVQASNSRISEKLAQMESRNTARNTLLAGGLNSALSFARGYERLKD